MDWVRRINAVLDYIEENLNGDIDDNRIASIFASPQGMFQRMFANITNMALAEYIRKRRLTKAAYDLRHTNEKIIDLSLKYGYRSAVAFSAAFKHYHGLTPSDARNIGFQPKPFPRLVFTLIVSEKGVDTMWYYNMEHAEYLLRQMADPTQARQYFQEHNEVKCACDGRRAAVILPPGTAEWDLTDAYLDVEETEKPKFELSPIFGSRCDDSLKIHLSKEQAAVLLVSFDGLKMDYNRKFISLPATAKRDSRNDALVCMDMNTMGIVTEQTALEREASQGKAIMRFNIKLIEESLKFIMCSDDSSIDIYFSGSLCPLLLKSGRLYAAVLPVKLRGSKPEKSHQM